MAILFLLINDSSGQETFKPVIDKDSVEKRLMDESGKINSIKSNFTQDKHLENLSIVIRSEGNFYFRQENKLKWEYTSPYYYLILINEGKFTIKDENKTNQYNIQSNKIFREINNIIINSVNGTLIKSGDFISNFFENEKTYLVRLIPKDKNMLEIITEIFIYFSKKDYTVEKIKIVEPGEDYSVITFSNKEINAEIPDKIFTVN